MKPIWVIENIVKEPSFLELSVAAQELGYVVLDIKGDYKREMIAHLIGGCVILNGSIEFCKLVGPQLQEQNNFPNTYTTFDNYLCTHYYLPFKKYLFNDKHSIISLKCLNEDKYEYYAKYGKEACIFVRPDSGDKSFRAGLVDLQDFDSFYDQFESLKDDLVIVSTPKTIRGEWRFVVNKNKEIIAQSSYRYEGLKTLIPSAPVGATELVKELLKVGYYPDSIFCFDICEDNDGEFWLMELTSFSCAGLYACNKKQIVEAISDMATKDWEIYQLSRN